MPRVIARIFEAEFDYLALGPSLVKLHSILAHARLVGQEIPSIGRVVVYMEWRGLARRRLRWDLHSDADGVRVVDDRFSKTITLDWAEIRNDYFEALRKISLPFLDLFALAGSFDPAAWFTRERVENLFNTMHARMRLFG